jgi:hypothetical protein
MLDSGWEARHLSGEKEEKGKKKKKGQINIQYGLLRILNIDLSFFLVLSLTVDTESF